MGNFLNPLQNTKGGLFLPYYCPPLTFQASERTTKDIQINPFVQFMKLCRKELDLEINVFSVIKTSPKQFWFLFQISLTSCKELLGFFELQIILRFIFLPATCEHKPQGAKFLCISTLANVISLLNKIPIPGYNF